MQELRIEPSEADQRLDRYLRKILPGAPLSFLYKMGRTKKVRLNGKKAEPDLRVEAGDVVTLYLSDGERAEFAKAPATEKPRVGRFEKSWILYEDEDLLVLDKPPGINVHPGDHKSDEASLIELAQDYLGKRYDTATFRPSLLHRLDRDTSGAIAIAKDRQVLNALLDDLQSDRVEKTYLALAVRAPEPPAGTVRVPLLRVEGAKKENKVRVDPAGQKAVTRYRTLRTSASAPWTLLEVGLETGRTHQIRVHLAHIGCPVLGDSTYGERVENARARKECGTGRQLLHAWKLAFVHPRTKKRLVIEAPMPADMLRALGE